MTLDFLAVHDALLAQGAASFSPEFRHRQVECVMSFRCGDGGFRGRMGESDPYYTDFACRTLRLLNSGPEALRDSAWYVLNLATPPKDVIDVFCRLNVIRLADMLEASTTSVYREALARITLAAAKPDQGVLDAYQAFLACLCRGILGEAVTVDVNRLPRLPDGHEDGDHRTRADIQSGSAKAIGDGPAEPRRGDSGNPLDSIAPPSGAELRFGASQTDSVAAPSGAELRFGAPQTDSVATPSGAELRFGASQKGGSGTHPDSNATPSGAEPRFGASQTEAQLQTSTTAATAAVLLMSGAMTPGQAENTAAFLTHMQADDGGFLAHPAAPHSDLLSTYTAFVTLAMLGFEDDADAVALARFLKETALPEGGFRSCALDTDADVEYTFYGVAAMALLHAKLA